MQTHKMLVKDCEECGEPITEVGHINRSRVKYHHKCAGDRHRRASLEGCHKKSKEERRLRKLASPGHY